MEVLGQIDLRYWQLASSEPMPDEFDVAVIEGAVTTEESERLVQQPARESRGRHRHRRVRDHARASPAWPPRGSSERPGTGVRQRARGVRRDDLAPRGRRRHRRRLRSALLPDRQLRFHRRAAARALRLQQDLPAPRTMCAIVQAQRDGLLLPEGRHVPGPGDAGGLRCALREPGEAVQRAAAGLSPDAEPASAARKACRVATASPVADFDKALEMFNQTDPALRDAEIEDARMTKTAITGRSYRPHRGPRQRACGHRGRRRQDRWR